MSYPDTAFTKNDYAYAQLRTRILTGDLAAGSVIGQAKLAAELGVSTTPLREAIRRLAAEGMIDLEAHRDARVTSVSAEEARHLYQVRESLDPLATSLAALNRTNSDIAKIEFALSRLEPITDAGDLEALLRHREFHRSVYCASGNPVLVDILERLWDKADRYRLVGLRHGGDSKRDRSRVESEHTAIYEAVAAGDADAASQRMSEHIRHSLGRRAIVALGDTSSV
ncbi:GntR family transcriptional regulator [Rhodococcus sp. 06-156-3C]|uniref:GntR family transcriptional regulator n=1 Tax=Nocardiaceae TaxID=85025 RepID=UPI000522E9F9|nr:MULTISPECIES: GntR family transcriptional regulator [Rhodococcus]OZD08796.1 GntR family transcriptional regulator [Rhodococcus sp. 06-156-4C]OZD17388.1 GntR family transcriptional regulator [Rhodococcus sp. 06-156-3C]OZD18726.1 GntR family transcriptional regulator [Rhodococcus sp. 06-156-4a]OZD25117.1 GntR family transcriptional regulator [Rhodococcus sp. 06-156-3b]OZD34276.1 GntR family transcriptional regulator [Rhodococcus sp. 06-156-3]